LKIKQLIYVKLMRKCIVTFFDTNVLIYFTINQDEQKFEIAKKMIFEAIKQDTFFISPMVLSEYIFVLSKYKLTRQHKDKVVLFSKYVNASIDNTLVLEAYDVCEKINFCKNINDVIHLKVADRFCQKLVTFDKDFKKLENYTDIEIEILPLKGH